MQAQSILYCFQLCLLIGICTAFPFPESDSKSESGSNTSDDDGKIVKLKGANEPVDAGEKDDVSGANEPVSEEENDDLSGANEPVSAEEKDVSGANEPVDEEEKNDVSVANQPIDAQDSNNLSEENQRVDARDNDNVSGTNQPVDAEENNVSAANQLEHNAKENIVSKANQPGNADKAGQSDSPSPNEDEVSASKENREDSEAAEVKDNTDITNPQHTIKNQDDIISEGCKKGSEAYCELVVEKLPYMPGFKLSEDEMTKFKIWPEAKIPYFIDEFSYDKVLRDKIRVWLEDARLLGLTFLELPEPPEGDEKRWVFFVNRRGQLDCKDYSTKSFTNTGVQKVIIGYDCLKHGGPIAAIVMALAGVPPQHNAPNRDQFITINKDHILPKKRGLFKKLSDGEWLFHDLGYDYSSISHYHEHKYSADGFPTITQAPAQRRSGGDVKPEELLKPMVKYTEWRLNSDAKIYSNLDIIKVRLLYNNLRASPDANPRLKEEDCNAMYRPGPNFKKLSLQLTKHVAEYPKPKKYLAATGNHVDSVETNESGTNTQEQKLLGLGYTQRDIEGEPLSALE